MASRVIRRLAERLKKSGLRVWLDEWVTQRRQQVVPRMAASLKTTGVLGSYFGRAGDSTAASSPGSALAQRLEDPVVQ